MLGWIGLALPLMPGALFLIAAAYCFARGNPAWERWMLDHPRLGPMLRDWRERRAIARPAKRAALATMALAGALAWLLIGYPWALGSLAILALVAVWLWTRPE